MHSKKAIGAAALALMMIAGIANAQTTYDQTTSGSGTTQTMGTSSTGATTGNPAVPNTGAGGTAAETAGLLTATGAIALAGMYLLRRRTV